MPQHHIFYGVELVSFTAYSMPLTAYYMVDKAGLLERFCIVYGSASHLHRIFDGPALHSIWQPYRVHAVSIAYRPRRVLCGRASHVTAIIACYMVRSAYYMAQHDVLYAQRRILYGPAGAHTTNLDKLEKADQVDR